ncbi:MAG TPA: flagellar protein FlgN [Desulfobacterales bacterium]|nr:flagellar protein FlgN [Desulfobacterales bacterium]HIP39805.1 flagellar protein FlgN [Desulfocapsa sulfexigens]
MIAGTTHDYLVRLRDVILEEREFTKALDMKSLADAMHEKGELIQVLAHVTRLDDEDKEIAATIRHENRRNAYLFKATLGWIRETMEFFGKRTAVTGYSANAGMVNSKVNGRLLSGRI